jgi:type I restriction enzyme S subunit
MSEWKEYKLGELGTVITGKTPSSRNPEDWGEEMLFITPSDYRNFGKHASNSERKLSSVGIERLKNKVLPPKSILVTCIGSDMGKVVMNDVHCITNQQINAIIPHVNVDNDFMYYLLVSIYDTLRIYGGDGTAVPIVNKKDFENIKVELPISIDDQRRIASILTSLDDKIDLLRCENATLEAMAETLFRQWFVVEAKEEWEEKPLSSIATFLNGLACQKYPPKNGIDKLPVLKIRELSSGIGSDSDWATTEVGEEYIVHAGDVIFAWSASLMVKIWDGEDCILNQHLFKVTSHKYPKWFYYFWCKHHLNEFISIAQSHATTMGHIKRGDLDTAMVLVPSDEELLSMTAQMEGLLNKMENNNEQMSTFIQTRDGLLPRLMSNEIAM